MAASNPEDSLIVGNTSGACSLAFPEPQPQTITFFSSPNVETVKITPEGKIFHLGREVETDREISEAIRDAMLLMAGQSISSDAEKKRRDEFFAALEMKLAAETRKNVILAGFFETMRQCKHVTLVDAVASLASALSECVNAQRRELQDAYWYGTPVYMVNVSAKGDLTVEAVKKAAMESTDRANVVIPRSISCDVKILDPIVIYCEPTQPGQRREMIALEEAKYPGREVIMVPLRDEHHRTVLQRMTKLEEACKLTLAALASPSPEMARAAIEMCHSALDYGKIHRPASLNEQLETGSQMLNEAYQARMVSNAKGEPLYVERKVDVTVDADRVSITKDGAVQIDAETPVDGGVVKPHRYVKPMDFIMPEATGQVISIPPCDCGEDENTDAFRDVTLPHKSWCAKRKAEEEAMIATAKKDCTCDTLINGHKNGCPLFTG